MPMIDSDKLKSLSEDVQPARKTWSVMIDLLQIVEPGDAIYPFSLEQVEEASAAYNEAASDLAAAVWALIEIAEARAEGREMRGL